MQHTDLKKKKPIYSKRDANLWQINKSEMHRKKVWLINMFEWNLHIIMSMQI
jgi:hypothetical protein